MEIERKFLINPDDFEYKEYPCKRLEQGYLNTDPVVRVRREGDEYNLPLTETGYEHLIQKADGNIIRKTRYLIPLGDLTIELDEFNAPFAPLLMAEVEFPDRETAESFTPPAWFGREVTNDPAYHNSNMSKREF